MREKEGEMIVRALATVTIQLSFVILSGDTNFTEFADDISALIYMMIYVFRNQRVNDYLCRADG